MKYTKYINKITKELAEENLAVFCGAGFSVASGFVDWRALMKPIADDLGLDIDEEHDLISIAQYHFNEKGGNRNVLNQLLIDEFMKDLELSNSHHILARLPIREYWTTNYDNLLEFALSQAGRNPDVKYTKEHLTLTKPKRDAIVYKIHGDVSHPNEAIVTKDDYENYSNKFAPYVTALSGALVSKTFLFMGFSFSDPNLEYILSRIRVNYSQNQRSHYCILREVQRSDFADDVQFNYAELHQRYFINDLKRFNIVAILIQDYSEIEEILQSIEHVHKRKTVFISGAAHDYGDWTDRDAHHFIHTLSKELVKRRCRIVSGFGLGVGSFVVSGVLEEIYLHPRETSQDQLILRPFPIEPSGSVNKVDLWHMYREDMCSYAGVAIFIFGNKLDGDSLVDSDGLMKEFKIAQSKDLFIIPVGSTGYMARSIYDIVKSDLVSFKYNSPTLQKSFQELGECMDAEKLIATILSVLDEIM